MQYLDYLKKALTDPTLAEKPLKDLIAETQFFFQVMRVKLEQKDDLAMQKEAAREIAAVREYLEERLGPK